MKYLLLLFFLLLGCSSPTAPKKRFETGGRLDEYGYGTAELPSKFGDITALPVVTCYIAPEAFSLSWSIIASGFLGGLCAIYWEGAQFDGYWNVEVSNSIPGWFFRAVVIF